MMKKRFFTILLGILFTQLSAQEWVVSYVGGPPDGLTTLVDGFIDEAGVTFLAGQEGSDENDSNALLMRIEPDGSHSEFKYLREGYRSKATCILEMNNHNLFVAGNLSDSNDDYIMVLILDKQLNLLVERQYAKEVEALSFRKCHATLDCHDNVIVSTAVTQTAPFAGYYYHGVFLKFNDQGDLLSHRYLIEDYPHPVYYLMDFRMRQMWYKEESESLLCLCTGYGGVLSFMTFDSAFNYIDEHPIVQDQLERSDHILNSEDSYIDYWYNEEEALVFSSLGDSDHNKLRASHVNTRGEFLEFVRLNERNDTIDDAANPKCMAACNDSTFYFLFTYHTLPKYPGFGCVYQINDRLEIVGRHVDDDHTCYQSRIILPTADNGCLVVYDTCIYTMLPHVKHPVIKKLRPSDFEQVFLSVNEPSDEAYHELGPYPNPAEHLLYLPLVGQGTSGRRLRIIDSQGLVVMDRIIDSDAAQITLDLSGLRPGMYQSVLYTHDRTLLTEKFIKK